MRKATWAKLVDAEDVHELADRIKRAPAGSVLAHDTETSGLRPYAGDFITGISVCLVEPPETALSAAHGLYVPVGHSVGNASEASTRELCEAMAATEATHVLHHCTFDWAFLCNLDKGYRPKFEGTVDTEVWHWLHDENMPKALKALGNLYLDEDADREQRELKATMAAPYGTISEARAAVLEAFPELGFYKIKGERVPFDGREGKKLWPNDEADAMAVRLRQKREWGNLLPDELAEYAARDASLTAQLAEVLCGSGVHDPAPELRREMRVQEIIHHMNRRGVSADEGRLAEAGRLYQGEAEQIASEFDHAFGDRMRKHFGRKEPFNLGSSQQVGWLLYQELDMPVMLRSEETGEPSTSKAALEQLQGDETVARILEYRHYAKAMSGYVGPFLEHLLTSCDGRIHGHYSSTRTVTGRLACSDPNLMTIPRKDSLPEIRECFYKVPAGLERIGFDLVSAELWVTASVTGDKTLIEQLQQGRDLHTEMAEFVFGRSDGRWRTLAKNVNYGSLYEAGVGALSVFAAKAGFSPKEAKRIAYQARDGHRKMYAQQHAAADHLAQVARDLGYIPHIEPGYYRHFAGGGVEYYTALNAVVQGGVANFMKGVMIELCDRGYGDLMVLQVHDELVFDAPVGMGEELHQVLTQISLDINPFAYPLTWDGKPWSNTRQEVA